MVVAKPDLVLFSKYPSQNFSPGEFGYQLLMKEWLQPDTFKEQNTTKRAFEFLCHSTSAAAVMNTCYYCGVN